MSPETEFRNGARLNVDPQESSSIHQTGLRYRTLTKAKSSVYLPRLVDRNLSYHQSKNRIAIRNENGTSKVFPLLMRDWFHVLLRLPFHVSIIGLLIFWVGGHFHVCWYLHVGR